MLDMGKSPQFNMRIPAEVLREFKDALAAVRAWGVRVDEQEAARAALLHFARLDRTAMLDSIESLRNYDIQRVKQCVVFEAWEKAVLATKAVKALEQVKVDTMIWHVVDVARNDAVSRYEYLRRRYPNQPDPFRGTSFSDAMDLSEEERFDLAEKNQRGYPDLVEHDLKVWLSAVELDKGLRAASQGLQHKQEAKRSGKRSASS